MNVTVKIKKNKNMNMIHARMQINLKIGSFLGHTSSTSCKQNLKLIKSAIQLRLKLSVLKEHFGILTCFATAVQVSTSLKHERVFHVDLRSHCGSTLTDGLSNSACYTYRVNSCKVIGSKITPGEYFNCSSDTVVVDGVAQW